jgi:hypothetical protein
MNSDVMIDCETLATGVKPVILTLGACKFDPLGDEINNPKMEALYLRIDIDSQIAVDRDVSDDTIEWWGRQSEVARDEALGDGTPENPRYTLEEAMDMLYKFCWGAKRVWSNGATADIIWCETAFKQVQRALPWKFWQVRDVRTAFDLGINPNMPEVTEHNALADAINQAIGIQTVYRELSRYVEPFKDWKKRG